MPYLTIFNSIVLVFLRSLFSSKKGSGTGWQGSWEEMRLEGGELIRTYYVIKKIISIREKSKKKFENARIKPTSLCVNKK